MNLRKLFLISLLISIIVLSIISYLNLAVLIKSLDVDIIVQKFQVLNKVLTYSNVILFFYLLILSNIIYFKKQKGFYFIITALFFVAFAFVDYMSIRQLYFAFRLENKLLLGSSSLSIIAGIFVSSIGVVIVVANFILLKRHLKKKEIKKKPTEEN